ncbi:MAG: DEAD/DEAH box helicase [Candidatus Lokiarchaeota archaeon]|nr:DEAD/DEAH box helicase [Candidatus Lokiarchaeota archaeon]
MLFELKIFQLREIQKEAIKKGLFFRKSFLVCAPSGSGKTLIGEVCAIHNVFQDFGKSIYLVPYKALATEKYFHFKKNYERFGLKIELSIGDYDVDDSKLQKADIIVTTYEKMDSILRNFYDKGWIFDISTIIIDEIHIIGESDRGPRLESLIVRLNEFLHNPQIIGLSATIANAEFFNSWLSSLGNKTLLIKSDDRPVPLHYKIEITQNKDSTIKRIIKNTLEKNGQVLIFLNKRKGAQQSAENIKHIVKKFLVENELNICKALEKRLTSIKGGHRDLRRIIKSGVAFHHAGLLSKERKIIEDNFKKRIIKVICCTTTLSAGVNTPARVVILKDFKKYVTSGHNIKNFTGFHENGDGFSYFKSFSANEVFQILGRAGRPGLDSVGYGIILTKNFDEKMWVEEEFFQNQPLQNSLIPRFNDLTSGLNKINTLKEQVLLRIYEEKKITLEQLKFFFEKTYFWYGIKHKMKQQKIPIEQLLMIKEITPINILKLHSDAHKLDTLMNGIFESKLSKFNDENISGYVKTQFGVYLCQFDITSGIQCSCGFENGISDNFANNEFSFEFCDHITVFLLYLIQYPDMNFQKYVDSIVPKSVKNQYILNYLFEKGLIIKNEDGTIKCSQFGKLIIRLYLYPVSGVNIRYKLENVEIDSFQNLIKEAYDVLKSEFRVKDKKMLQPILEWADEEPIEEILERYNIMTGDLFSVRDNIERIITFIGIIASNLSTHGIDLQDKLVRIAEMAETLKIRLHYGIREELFDLVLRLNDVARVRARILYNAGYHTASQVKKENPYVLNQKTGLGINLCKKIIKKEK